MIRLSIRRPVAVTMAYLALALLGAAAWRGIPIELLPDTQLPRLYVEASWRGASPETTEALLTSPLEAAVQQVRGVETVSSESSDEGGAGRARVTVEFARGTDMDFARLELIERLAALEPELPRGADPPRVRPYVPREFAEQQRPFLSYTLTGPYTLEALRAHADEEIAAALRQVDGVADVAVWGGRQRVIELELDAAKVQAFGLSPDDVRRRVLELELVREAGAVDDAGVLRLVAIRERAESVAEVLRTPLVWEAGRDVRVRDVARVHDTHEEPASHYRIDGLPALSFDVLRESGTNAVAVADRVKAAVARLETSAPAGVRLILDADESEAIRAQLTDLRYRALVAAAVIFLVLLLFLRSLRSTAIIFATIGFSILIAVNLIYFGGLTLNVLTLMGLAMGFGLIVDNAIVVLENVYRRRRAGEEPAVAAERGAGDVVLPILASTLTTLIVLVPFVYLQGELRIYYVPLAIAVGLSLLASLFVAFTFIPALAARVLSGAAGGQGTMGGGAGGGSDPAHVRAYRGFLQATLRFPWLAALIALLALGGSYHLFDKYVTRGVLWGRWWGDDTYISVQVALPRGEELARTDELVRHFEAKLRSLPEVDRFVTQVYPQNANIRVTFPDSLELTAVPVAIKEQMVGYSHLFGGAEVRVYGFGPSFYGGGSSPPNYSIQVLGYNYERVAAIAEDLARRLRRFSRIRDVDTNSSGRWFERDKATEVVLRLDRARLAMHGLGARDVVRHVGAAVQGRAWESPFRLAGDEVRLGVTLAGSRDIDVLALRETLLPAPGGQGVRLGDVATLEERETLARILREDQQYQRRVSYEFRGPTKLGNAVRDAVLGATALPPGYQILGRDEWRWDESEERQIYGVLALALVLVFMATAALFESLRQPFVVLLTVPMALVGVFLIFFYTGASFTREAYIGVIMMGGIVVNNAILLVDHINRLRRAEGMALEGAVIRGALERARPILMTSATTIFGLLPLVLFSEAADSNIWNALGYALIGGLASSTLLVLTVTPGLYLLMERAGERRESV